MLQPTCAGEHRWAMAGRVTLPCRRRGEDILWETFPCEIARQAAGPGVEFVPESAMRVHSGLCEMSIALSGAKSHRDRCKS